MAFSVRNSLAWMVFSQGTMFVLQFGTSVVVAHLLTPYDMGVFAVASSLLGLLSTIRALGLNGYIIRAVELDQATIATAFTINTLLAIVVAAAIAGLSVIGAVFLHEDGVRSVLLVLAWLPLINAFEFLPAAGVEREGGFRSIALLGIVRSVLANAVLLSCALVGFSYMSLAYGQVSAALISAIWMNVVGRRFINRQFGLSRWREILNYGLQMLAVSGVNMLSARVAEIALGRILGLSALGLYSRASGLTSMLWDNIHIVITRVVFVDFAEQTRQGRSLRVSYLRVTAMMTGLLWPAFTGLAVISGPLVLTLYGRQWLAAAVPLSLLAMSAFVLVAVTMAWEIFVVSHETNRQMRFESVRAGVGGILFILGCFGGLAWAASARVIEAIFAVVLYRPHLERMTQTRWQEFLPIYVQSFALTLCATVPSILVMTVFDWSADTPVIALLSAAIIGMLAWAAGLHVLRHPLYAEFLHLRQHLSKPTQSSSAE